MCFLKAKTPSKLHLIYQTNQENNAKQMSPPFADKFRAPTKKKFFPNVLKLLFKIFHWSLLFVFLIISIIATKATLCMSTHTTLHSSTAERLGAKTKQHKELKLHCVSLTIHKSCHRFSYFPFFKLLFRILPSTAEYAETEGVVRNR